jgi:hypothetical protein
MSPRWRLPLLGVLFAGATALCALAQAVETAVLPVASSPRDAELKFIYDDRFSDPERLKLEAWITEVVGALQVLVGPLPMDVRFRFARHEGAGPVPWANTLRGRRQGVRFYVDPTQAVDAFRKDWTAPHELSHLVLPFVGRQHAWFSEGFASFMQYRVMRVMGVLDDEAMAARYRERLDTAASAYSRPNHRFVEAVPQLRAEGLYPTIYWGGASYFLEMEERLHRNGTSLIGVLAAYMACCRRNEDDLDALVATLDDLAGSTTLSEGLTGFRRLVGFPPYRHLQALSPG